MKVYIVVSFTYKWDNHEACGVEITINGVFKDHAEAMACNKRNLNSEVIEEEVQ